MGEEQQRKLCKRKNVLAKKDRQQRVQDWEMR